MVLAAEVGSHLVLALPNLFDTLRMDSLKDGQFVNTAYRSIALPSTTTALLGDGGVLVAAFASEQLQHSTDLGRTRSPERRLPETITSLAGRLDRLFALGAKALYATSDSGKTWSILPAADPDGAPLRHLAGDPSLLAALTAQGGVLVSRDSARSWSPLPELPSGLLPVAVAVHAGKVAVGTRDHGVFLWGEEESVTLRGIRDGEGSGLGGRAFRPGWVRSPGGWLYRTAPGTQVDLRGRSQAIKD
jgi:hypothetical protein